MTGHVLFRSSADSYFVRSVALVLVFFSALWISSCGKSNSSSDGVTEGKIGSTEFVKQGSGELVFAEGVLSGSGTAAAKLPLGELASSKNFSLAFSLEDGGSLTLIGYGKEALADGVVLKFERKAAVVSAALSMGEQEIDLSPVFTNLDATGELGVTVDIHNNETPAHVIAWTADIKEPDENNPVYESERDEPSRGAVPGNGRGTFWGLVVSKARVTTAEVGEPKFEEEE